MIVGSQDYRGWLAYILEQLFGEIAQIQFYLQAEMVNFLIKPMHSVDSLCSWRS